MFEIEYDNPRNRIIYQYQHRLMMMQAGRHNDKVTNQKQKDN